MTKIENNLVKQLCAIGLKQNEAEIYLFLLQNGPSVPLAIAKGTSIARTNCYNILKILLGKEVVTEQLRGKKKVYSARDPQSLKRDLVKKIESVDTLLPDLEALHKTQKNKPLFRFYEGFTEVKDIYELSLDAQEIYALGSTERLNDLDAKFFRDYTQKCEKRKIIFRDLLTADSQKSGKIIKEIRGDLHHIKFLPPEYSKNITDILLWNDNLALISLDSPIFGTIIQSPALADTLRTIFKFISSKI